MKFLLLSLSCSFLLVGCYNKNFNEPGQISIDQKPTKRTLGSSFDRSWASTQRIFAKFPITKKASDEVSSRAYIVTDWIKGQSDILYSGYDVNRVPYPIRYKLYVYVTGGTGGQNTQIEIKNIEQYKDDVVTAGVDFDGSLYSWIRTESSTLKEARLLDEIEKLVKNPRFNP